MVCNPPSQAIRIKYDPAPDPRMRDYFLPQILPNLAGRDAEERGRLCDVQKVFVFDTHD